MNELLSLKERHIVNATIELQAHLKIILGWLEPQKM